MRLLGVLWCVLCMVFALAAQALDKDVQLPQVSPTPRPAQAQPKQKPLLPEENKGRGTNSQDEFLRKPITDIGRANDLIHKNAPSGSSVDIISKASPEPDKEKDIRDAEAIRKEEKAKKTISDKDLVAQPQGDSKSVAQPRQPLPAKAENPAKDNRKAKIYRKNTRKSPIDEDNK